MRYERKFRIEDIDYHQILQVFRLHPSGLRPLHDIRQINNIYFDTPQLTTYKDNVMGLAERKKFRVRWYGEEITNVQKPLLEIKQRLSEIGLKFHHAVSEFSLDNLQQLIREVNQKSGSDALLMPVLLNSYKRAYYSTNDEKFRLTLDWDLSYTGLLGTPNFKKHHIKEYNVSIVEIKYDIQHEADVDRVVQYLPFRRTKNSKYVTGVDLCIQ